MANDIVYILTNEAMPGFIKIGKTTNLEQRLKSLDTTGIPLPFECFYACQVSDGAFVEQQLHLTFSDRRVRSSREFFACSCSQAAAALRLAEIKDVTPKRLTLTEDDETAISKVKSRRANFRFSSVDISIGSVLTFYRRPDVTATVIDDRQIELQGEVVSLSSSAQRLLGVEHPVQGTVYWLFDDETLDNRRLRIEAENSEAEDSNEPCTA